MDKLPEAQEDPKILAVKKQRAREKEWRQKNREKTREYSRRYRANNLEKDRARVRKYNREHPEQAREWERNNKDKRKAITKRYLGDPVKAEKSKQAARNWQKSERGKEIVKKWHIKRLAVPANRIKHLLNGARWRCGKRGLPFDDTLYKHLMSNVPKTCACCFTELDYSTENMTRKNDRRSPSLDRLDSKDGYTMKNVAVVCTRCNLAKHDASLAELRLLVAYVEREQKARGTYQESDQ